MIRLLKKLYYTHLFRKIDADLCCCGSDLKDHGYGDNHTFRSAKEYAITCLCEK